VDVALPTIPLAGALTLSATSLLTAELAELDADDDDAGVEVAETDEGAIGVKLSCHVISASPSPSIFLEKVD
jgi:hypothetical protein